MKVGKEIFQGSEVRCEMGCPQRGGTDVTTALHRSASPLAFLHKLSIFALIVSIGFDEDAYDGMQVN